MDVPALGSLAPDFSLLNQDDTLVNLRETLGTFVVIYFYPKAMTPGCTLQACSLRDHWSDICSRGVRLYGISPDSPAQLREFKLRDHLPFDLLSDPGGRIAQTYGCWGVTHVQGRAYTGILRTTFLLNPQNQLIDRIIDVTPATHFEQLITLISHHIH